MTKTEMMNLAHVKEWLELARDCAREILKSNTKENQFMIPVHVESLLRRLNFAEKKLTEL